MAPSVVGGARSRSINVVDATCPFVAVAQRKAAALREAGYAVVILGERDHPEVAGLEGFAGEGAVVVEEAGGLPVERLRGKRVGVVVQTTQTQANLASVAAALAPVARELLVYNTICDATEKRQNAACELGAEVDVVVVVGGRNSANTARLAQLCRAIESRTYHIESAGRARARVVRRRAAHRRDRGRLDARRGDRRHRQGAAGALWRLTRPPAGPGSPGLPGSRRRGRGGARRAASPATASCASTARRRSTCSTSSWPRPTTSCG